MLGIYSLLDNQGWINECNRRQSWLNQTNFEDHNKWLIESKILSNTANLVDIGCGVGIRTSAYARYLKEGRVKGFDINDLVLNKAREFAAQNNIFNVSFHKMEPNQVLLDDLSIDCVCLDSVLWAVANPLVLLTEASRLIKPLGFLMAKNFDAGGFLMSYPELPLSFKNLFSSFELATENWGGDIFIGRKLPLYLTQVGLTVKKVWMEPEITTGSASEEQVNNFWIFFSQWQSLLVNGGYITNYEYDCAKNDFEEWSTKSSRVQMRTTIRVLAQK